MFKLLNIGTISTTTFAAHASRYVQPAIYRLWREDQDVNIGTLQTLMNGKAIVAGDGRADSPGHCAKYGTYTFLEVRLNKILDVQLVQGNETGGSARFEKEGFLRCVRFLNDFGVDISELITDRHPQIIKYVKENMQDTVHSFDVWHVAKGFKKKMTQQIQRTPSATSLRDWVKSTVNHMYWSAASSDGEPKEMIIQKWTSILNHIQNVHEGHGDLFPSCLHGRLEDQQKQWLDCGSPAFSLLEKLVLDRHVLKNVQMLSTHFQTSSLEAFHSLLLQFTPKLVLIHTRVCLAGYANNILRILATASNDEMVEMRSDWEVIQAPPPLSAQFSRPSLDDVAQSRTSRFSSK